MRGSIQSFSLARDTTCVMQENCVQMETAMILTAPIYTEQALTITVRLQTSIIEL